VYDHPNLLLPGVTDASLLYPLYMTLVSTIRRNDNNHAIFFESTVQDAVFVTGLPKSIDANAVYSYHIYCGNTTKNVTSTLCKDVLRATLVSK
jgi:hypothetical protein